MCIDEIIQFYTVTEFKFELEMEEYGKIYKIGLLGLICILYKLRIYPHTGRLEWLNVFGTEKLSPIILPHQHWEILSEDAF